MPRVSVVIPCHNDRATIGRCVTSLTRQTCPPVEIIVVDDASSDDPSTPLADLPVTLVRREQQGGAGRAREAGAERAKGEILAFLDADCVAPPDWIDRIESAFAADATLIGVGGGYRHPEREAETLAAQAAAIEESVVHRMFAQHPDDAAPPGGNCAYRRDAWEHARTAREVVHFAGMASGEDTVVGHDLRDAGRVRFHADLVVDHTPKRRSYLRRHYVRGLSRATIIGYRMTSRAETRLVFQAFGGWRMFVGSLCLVGIVPSLALAWLAPAAALGVAALLLVAHATLTSRYLASAFASPSGERPAALALPRRLALRALFAGRAISWMAGGMVGASRYLGHRARVAYNVALSVAHFWRPGRISKLFYFVTSRCNARCSFCFNLENVVNWKARQPLELTLAEVERVAKAFKRLPYLTLSGGEPFVRTDLADVVHAFYRYARTQWVTIPTNAALTSRTVSTVGEILNRCPGLFLTIQVSIDALHGEHDESRVLRDGFAKLSETLAALGRVRRRYANLRIQLATCYDHFNAHRMQEIIDHCRTTFEYDQHMFYLVRDSHARVTSGNNDLVDAFMGLVAANEAWEWQHLPRRLWSTAVRVLHALTYRDLTRIKVEGEFLRPCTATQKFATLWDDGSVSPCEILEHTRLGNIRDHGYDYYRLKREAAVDELHRRDIVDAKCNCDWACAPPINMLYDRTTFTRIARGLIRPDAVLRDARTPSA